MEVSMLNALGRVAYRRRWLIVGLWLVVFLTGITVGSGVFHHLKDAKGDSSAESVQGLRILDAATKHGPRAVAVIDGAPADSPATRAAVEAASMRLSALPFVEAVAHAYNSPD